MSAETYIRDVITGRKQGLAAGALRMLLRLVSVPYSVFQRVKAGLYRTGLRRQISVARPVVVVGNLTMGGTGKTTTVAYIVGRLTEAGIRAGIILRGYKRESGLPPLLVTDGAKMLVSTSESGDEAALLATTLAGHPVAVGTSRVDVARMLIDQCAPDALVLDDGFGHLRLARDADIVLIDASHDIEADRILPAGTLREPTSALRRATQLWITHAELDDGSRVERLQAWLEAVAPGIPIVTSEHRAGGLRSLTGAPTPASGARVVAMSGLGNPRSFEGALERLGYEVESLVFKDHHHYTHDDWDRVRECAEATDAKHVVTTEKDAVKLPAVPPDIASVHVLGCELAVTAGAEHVATLIERVKSCRSQ